MIIYLDDKAMKYKVEVQDLIDDELWTNVNFNGAEYEIKRDEYTWIDKCDEIKATILLHQIYDLIEELEEKI